ncbi:ATP-binding protein [Clostridium sardiniense]|uniref:ATP-binding protein n=1 Tax=Clostridium sardiniense TaxID=29369 RepID=UPI00195C5476|nr:ATP-binding protein [Clostridium sardiniense]MBM7833526.1 two-component system CitB family sensor kinase [Clostridium sardiniense]
MSFKRRIRKRSIIIAAIPLVLTFAFFMNIRVDDIKDGIKKDLKEIAYVVSNTPLVQEKLAHKENDFSIQKYVQGYIEKFDNVDIIVTGDMSGEKYSHLDSNQIGKKYVNPDNTDVIKYGTSYYSTMKGSMGVTLRYFEPVYYNGHQVGFVMVGKYLKDVQTLTNKVIGGALLLFIIIITITIFLSESFARKIKKEMLGMEPDEIARLYNEKKIILDSIDEGVIAIDNNNKILEINDNCLKIFDNLNIDELIDKLDKYIKKHESVRMKEINLSGEKVFINLSFIKEQGKYLGAVVTLLKGENINRLAREITGIDGLLKSVRANVHEFKNKLHVILGLINVEEYEEAKKYIYDCQKEVLENSTNVANINDNLISAMLLSKKLIAKERNIEFIIDESSYMKENHGNITSIDLITILGNLIENAFDACVEDEDESFVKVFIDENDKEIEIEVSDNGKKINKSIKDKLFENGVSSKGEGRGIGLSTVKGRVDLYEGSIEIKEYRKHKKFKVVIQRMG